MVEGKTFEDVDYIEIRFRDWNRYKLQKLLNRDLICLFEDKNHYMYEVYNVQGWVMEWERDRKSYKTFAHMFESNWFFAKLVCKKLSLKKIWF